MWLKIYVSLFAAWAAQNSKRQKHKTTLTVNRHKSKYNLSKLTVIRKTDKHTNH